MQSAEPQTDQSRLCNRRRESYNYLRLQDCYYIVEIVLVDFFFDGFTTFALQPEVLLCPPFSF